MSVGVIVLGILALVVFLVAARSVRIIPQSRVAIVQRFGRYHRTAGSGLTFVVPVVDRMLPKTDLREQVISVPPQAPGHIWVVRISRASVLVSHAVVPAMLMPNEMMHRAVQDHGRLRAGARSPRLGLTGCAVGGAADAPSPVGGQSNVS